MPTMAKPPRMVDRAVIIAGQFFAGARILLALPVDIDELVQRCPRWYSNRTPWSGMTRKVR